MAMEGTIKNEPEESYEEEDESTFSIDISETMSLVEMERRCVKQEVDDNGKQGGGKVAPGGSGEARGSVDDNDPSRKEAVEKARKWLEDYFRINRKPGRPKKKHKATNPNPLSFECPVCLLMFQSEGVLAKHIPFCADLKLFKCRVPSCDKTFRNLSKVREHYQRCHLSLQMND